MYSAKPGSGGAERGYDRAAHGTFYTDRSVVCVLGFGVLSCTSQLRIPTTALNENTMQTQNWAYVTCNAARGQRSPLSTEAGWVGSGRSAQSAQQGSVEGEWQSSCVLTCVRSPREKLSESMLACMQTSPCNKPKHVNMQG